MYGEETYCRLHIGAAPCTHQRLDLGMVDRDLSCRFRQMHYSYNMIRLWRPRSC